MSTIFEVYVKDNKDWLKDKSDNLQVTVERAQRLRNVVRSKVESESVRKLLDAVVVDIVDIKSEIDAKHYDMVRLHVSNESNESELRGKISKLEIEIGKLKTELSCIKSGDKDNYVIDFGDTKVNSSVGSVDYEILSSRVNTLLDAFEENIRSIAVGHKMRTEEYKARDMSGKNSPRYVDISEQDMEELVDRYRLAGNKLNKSVWKDYAAKYGVTKECLMYKLKQEGVWVYRNGGKHL